MPDDLNENIETLRHRSQELEESASIILKDMRWIFFIIIFLIFASAIVPSFDILIHKNLSFQPENIISEIVTLKKELPAIQTELNDKKRKLKQLRYDEIHSYDFDVILGDLSNDNDSLGYISYPIVYNGNSHISIYPVESVYDDLGNIKKELTDFISQLKSPNRKNDIIHQLESTINNSQRSKETFEERIKAAQDEIKNLEVINPRTPYIEEEIKKYKNIIDQESKSLREQVISLEKYQHELNNVSKIDYSTDKNTLKSINDAENAIKQIDDIFPKLSEAITKRRNEYTNINQEIPALEDQVLSYETKIDKLVNEPDNNSGNDSNMAFVISTNITRLVCVVVALFFAQMLYSIYRYKIRLATFYTSRADSLSVISKTSKDIKDSIQVIAEFFTPKDVEFGKTPNIPTEDVQKLLNLQQKSN